MFTSAVLAFTLLSSGAVESPRLVADRGAGEGAWQVRVATAGLALDREADAREMLARLRTAAKAICAQEMKARASRDWHGCKRETLAHVVQQVNAPLVTAAYEAER